MKFIRDLLGKKRGKSPAQPKPTAESLEDSYRNSVSALNKDAEKNKGADTQANVNIWDMDDGAKSPNAPSPEAAEALMAAASRSPARSRRTKTRLIGFEHSDGDVVDLFNDAPKEEEAAPVIETVKFPVGWVVVTEGPGRGESFALATGMSQIGRGDDQAVKLDFGDNSISRTNHAAIVFDDDTKEFLLGHGGKSNIVRLNDKPLISNEPIKSGDTIRISDTVLRFVALCGEDFQWSESPTEEDEDVAIA